ncbi:polysaccharide biosynthesis protein [Desulfogranum mediterraneum]|uniref:polysaccharide biosynthesis protein n=1 Tax=Desulfogranum mediterraneum TaxID=160661 RepID=UPI00041ADE6E|nr:nucleoside-diphosphate sugar epimerase/dehydratase [Desulfogranum mediterraneum]
MSMSATELPKRSPLSKLVLRTVPNQWLVAGMDLLAISIAITLAFLFRFDGIISGQYARQILLLIPLLLLVKIPVFSFCGLYRGMFRYTSLADILAVLQAVVISSALVVTGLMMLNRFANLSRGVFVLDCILTFLLIAGNRTLIRCLYQYSRYGDGDRRLRPLFLCKDGARPVKRLVLIGAGNSAEKTLRETKENPRLPYQVVGLVDDDPKKQGLQIHGVPVLGPITALKAVVKQHRVDELLIAISTANSSQMQRIVDICSSTGVSYKILPGMHELIHGNVSLQTMREVDYKDLLGRPTVELEQDEIGRYLSGKTVLVTGAGGSIGSELCRQILKFEPEQLILLDAGEENLYNIQMELHHQHGFTDYLPVLGKIQNRSLLDELFALHKPSVVFHAAAYKHVPLVERNPWEAVFNNVFAVRNVIEASINHQVDRFVLVSTDKAVRPTNVMGATKRLTELLMLAYSQEHWDGSLCQGRRDWLQGVCKLKGGRKECRHNTTFMAVRFGNVLGSSGSVVPLFKRQIEKGGPVTVTHPEVTRYFMSIEEAAQLILQAGAMGQGGEIFILKMGQPVKIVDMARDLIRMTGKEPGRDIELSFTGLRPGEKLYEELITAGEGIVTTPHDKIMVLRGDGKSYALLEPLLSRLADHAQHHDAVAIKEVLTLLVPEYVADFAAPATIVREEDSARIAA